MPLRWSRNPSTQIAKPGTGGPSANDDNPPAPVPVNPVGPAPVVEPAAPVALSKGLMNKESTETLVLGFDPRGEDKNQTVKTVLQTPSSIWGLGQSLTGTPSPSRESLPCEPIVNLPYKPGGLDDTSFGHLPDLEGDVHFLDCHRVCVWRNSEWHPMAPEQQRQIKLHVQNGSSTFKISDAGYSWTVHNEDGRWFQVSPAGTKRPLLLTPSMNPIGATRLPTLQKSKGMGTDGGSFIQALRTEWSKICLYGATFMTRDDLVNAWTKGMAADDADLLIHVATDTFQRADFEVKDKIPMCHWFHFRLLEYQAPSMHSITQLNQRLITWLEKDSKILQRLQELFVHALGEDAGTRLSGSQLKFAVRTWVGQASNEMMTEEYIGHLNKLMSSNDGLEEGEPITYYEFLHYMLGRSAARVQLYYYDLSHGSSRWWSPVVFGKKMESIWHCGVVVHDKEYRYGGNIFESRPGRTAFGEPAKVSELGTTHRTREEVLSFINRRLAHLFAVDSYQVFTNNSNNFCDEFLVFLLNQRLTSEVMEQPKQIMNSQACRMMSTWLPWLDGKLPDNTRLLSMQRDQWGLLKQGMLVTFEFEDGWICIGRMLAKLDNMCDVLWLDSSEGVFRIKTNVPREHVEALHLPETRVTLSLPQRRF
mmetsp:Transcript_114159/g.208861  ORF Transcript_114159/g.208861 Transcript_114159/m.208861 type:complete len:647 (+) Transcript_114159:66-2006(+)